MAMQLPKIVKMLDKSGIDAYYNESDMPEGGDDEVIIPGSKFGLSVCSHGGYYAMLCEYERDNDGNITAMIDHGTAENYAQLKRLLVKVGFSLK